MITAYTLSRESWYIRTTGYVTRWTCRELCDEYGCGWDGSAGAGYEYAVAGIGAAGGAVAMQSARSRKAPTPLGSALVVPAITQVTKSGLRTLLSPDLVHNRMRSTIKAVVFPG